MRQNQLNPYVLDDLQHCNDQSSLMSKTAVYEYHKDVQKSAVMKLASQIAKMIKQILLIFYKTKIFIQTYTGSADKLSKQRKIIYRLVRYTSVAHKAINW